MQVEQLDALMAAVHRLEATEARLQRRARTLSEHLLAAERRNARLLPAEEEIRRLGEEVARLTSEREGLTAKVARLGEEVVRLSAECDGLTAERDGLTTKVARLDSVIRERDATLAEVLESETWALTAPLRALLGRLAWLKRQ
jgi:chromosome segregation ATPase